MNVKDPPANMVPSSRVCSANTAPGSRRARVDAIDAELVAIAAEQAAREGGLADLDRRIRALIRG
jgi:hypothetical protein